MRHRRRIYWSLALTLVAGLLAVPATPAAPATAGCGTSVIPLYTFHLEWKPVRNRYRIGEIARIHVNVTRPGEEDPLGEGIPTPRPTQIPAEDVRVGVGLLIGDYPTHGSGRTDENGDAVVRVPIPSWMKPGPARASGRAENFVAYLACFDVWEYGFKRQDNFFRVTD